MRKNITESKEDRWSICGSQWWLQHAHYMKGAGSIHIKCTDETKLDEFANILENEIIFQEDLDKLENWSELHKIKLYKRMQQEATVMSSSMLLHLFTLLASKNLGVYSHKPVYNDAPGSVACPLWLSS